MRRQIEDSWLLYLMTNYPELKYKEMAEILGCSPSAITRRRKELEKYLPFTGDFFRKDELLERIHEYFQKRSIPKFENVQPGFIELANPAQSTISEIEFEQAIETPVANEDQTVVETSNEANLNISSQAVLLSDIKSILQSVGLLTDEDCKFNFTLEQVK